MSDRKKTGPKRLLKDAPITTPDHNTRNRNKNKNRNRNNVSNKSRQKETAPTVGRHKFLQLVHPVNLWQLKNLWTIIIQWTSENWQWQHTNRSLCKSLPIPSGSFVWSCSPINKDHPVPRRLLNHNTRNRNNIWSCSAFNKHQFNFASAQHFTSTRFLLLTHNVAWF